MWGDEVVHYTLDGTITTGGNSNYAQDGDGLTQNGISWSVTGNTTINPWRIGGKVNSGTGTVDREAYSKTAMTSAITKIELEIGDINLSSVNSIKLIVASNSDFSSVVEEITKSPVAPATSIAANQTLTFNPTLPLTEWATGAYYKLVFNVGLTTSNKYIQVKSVKFYKEVSLEDPTITFNDGIVRVGKTLNLSTLFTSNSSGTVTYSITEGDSYASIDDNILTGVAEGDVTVQASQASYGAYNAKAVTATISVTDPALSSIAITTAPTKTTYDEGDLFDATGMVVTATFADASTEDVTASCTWTPSGALATTDDEVTISYTYSAVTKTATQAITVNAYVQPTNFDIALNNTLFGTSYSGTASGITDENPESGTLNRVTVTYAGSGNHYINNSQIRFYPNNKLTFAAPAGYVITQIVFTADGTWAATINANTGTYTSSTKTWTGEASSVLFTGSGSSRCDMSKAAITLSSTVAITPAKTYTTYVSAVNLDFSSVSSDIKAYVAASTASEGSITFTGKDAIPAGTPLLIKATTPGATVNVPVAASADAVGTNYLVAGDGGNVTYDAGAGQYYYILTNGEFKQANNSPVAVGKAYLALPSAATSNELTINFDDEVGDVTDIATVSSKKQYNGEYYNLNGQRVDASHKGIVIVNGKKFFNK